MDSALKSEDKNKDLIGLLNGAIDQLEQEKGSLEHVGRPLNELEQDQVQLINKAIQNIQKAREEVFQAYCGGCDNCGPNEDYDIDSWLAA